MLEWESFGCSREGSAQSSRERLLDELGVYLRLNEDSYAAQTRISTTHSDPTAQNVDESLDASMSLLSLQDHETDQSDTVLFLLPYDGLNDDLQSSTLQSLDLQRSLQPDDDKTVLLVPVGDESFLWVPVTVIRDELEDEFQEGRVDLQRDVAVDRTLILVSVEDSLEEELQTQQLTVHDQTALLGSVEKGDGNAASEMILLVATMPGTCDDGELLQDDRAQQDAQQFTGRDQTALLGSAGGGTANEMVPLVPTKPGTCDDGELLQNEQLTVRDQTVLLGSAGGTANEMVLLVPTMPVCQNDQAQQDKQQPTVHDQTALLGSAGGGTANEMVLLVPTMPGTCDNGELLQDDQAQQATQQPTVHDQTALLGSVEEGDGNAADEMVLLVPTMPGCQNDQAQQDKQQPTVRDQTALFGSAEGTANKMVLLVPTMSENNDNLVLNAQPHLDAAVDQTVLLVTTRPNNLQHKDQDLVLWVPMTSEPSDLQVAARDDDPQPEELESSSDLLEDRFGCAVCVEPFLIAQQAHAVATGRIRYNCVACGKSYATALALRRHNYKIHEVDVDEMTVLCELCGKTVSKEHKSLHYRIHAGEKPHKCLTCNKSFSRKQFLNDHERTHTGERPFVCRFCGRAFSQYTPRKIHERIHTGEKPYECIVCGSGFISKVARDSHWRCCRKKKQK